MVKITSKGEMNVKNIAAAEGGSSVTQTNTEGPVDNRSASKKLFDSAFDLISKFIPGLK